MRNKKILIGALVALLALGGAAAVFAGNTATQTVTFEVTAISEITVSGNPGPMTVNAAVAGAQPTQVTDASTTYNITINQTGKITGALNNDMPAGVTLAINMTTPGAPATSAGDKSLSTGAVDLVTGITPLIASTKTITYKLSALVTAGVIASSTRIVTLTVVAP